MPLSTGAPIGPCMDERGMQDAFTLDPDFERAGFKRLLRG